MDDILTILLKISLVIFMAGNLLDLGLRLKIGDTLKGIKNFRFVVHSLLWGFLIIPAVAWLLWAAWEWAILTFSPEADIRVDLLIIIPLVMIASAAGLVLPFVPRGQ